VIGAVAARGLEEGSGEEPLAPGMLVS
jgi:hypothetical protein